MKSERDQLQGDRNRLILQKDKLETLCRGLQKQNKIIQVILLSIYVSDVFIELWENIFTVSRLKLFNLVYIYN